MAESSQGVQTKSRPPKTTDANARHQLYKQLLKRMSKLPKLSRITVPDREPWPPPSHNLARPPIRTNRSSDLRTKRSLQPPPIGVLDFHATHKGICHRGFLPRTFPPRVGALSRQPRQIAIHTSPGSQQKLKRPPQAIPKVPWQEPKKWTPSEEHPREQVARDRTEPGLNQTPPLPKYPLLYDISRQLDHRTISELENEIENTSYRKRMWKLCWDAFTQVAESQQPYPNFSNHLVIGSVILVGILKIKAIRDFWRSFENAP